MLDGARLPPKAFFSGSGLWRADLLRAKPEALADLAARGDARQLQWANGLPLLDAAGRLVWGTITNPLLFLGLDGDAPRFSALPDAPPPATAFAMLAQLDPENAPIFACALSLANWHARHGHCSVCGQPSAVARGGWSRHCLTCSADHFPRCDPVVIMLAEHDGRLLLGRQPHYPPGRFSALAGFVEPGETIEAAVAREFMEEAGIEVADIAYVASQPWPFPSSLMIGCAARALGAELTIDFTELDDARWFTRDEVEAAVSGRGNTEFLAPPPHAIARTLLDNWLALK